MIASKSTKIIVGVLSLLFLFAIYSNHFDNDFHFDDSHTVSDNPAIRNIKNIPSYFLDANTFSSLPANRMYRPLTTASLAIDYWLGGGLTPFMFHVSTFCWFVVQLLAMWFLFRRLLVDYPAPAREIAAFLATLFYGAHPVCSETINYVIQRADLYSTLGVIGGLIVYIYYPSSRSKLLYLLPPLLGCLCKQAAIMFAPIFWLYLIVLETTPETSDIKGLIRNTCSTFTKTLPAWILCIGFYILQARMSPPSASFGGSSVYHYAITQPFVIFAYFTRFFVPINLTADTDWSPLQSAVSVEFISGMLFLIATVAVALKALITPRLKSVGFGLFWFLFALVPTSSFIPFAEVMNDHRMFFPFVGLVVAVANIGLFLFETFSFKSGTKTVLTAIYTLYIAVFAAQTWKRNEVWHSEESLWLDTSQKSPNNGRALMNYGLTQMSKGDYLAAQEKFKAAQVLYPNYVTLAINLGVVEGGLGNKEEAEQHFRRALSYNTEVDRVQFFFGRWLFQVGRVDEALGMVRSAIKLNPMLTGAKELLLQILLEEGEIAEAKKVASDLLLQIGDHPLAKSILTNETTDPDQFRAAGTEVSYLLDRSLLFYSIKDFKRAIAAANSAIILEPTSARAYNNLGASYNGMEDWANAKTALAKAVEIDPSLTIAKNNLRWAEEELAKRGANHLTGH